MTAVLPEPAAGYAGGPLLRTDADERAREAGQGHVAVLRALDAAQCEGVNVWAVLQ